MQTSTKAWKATDGEFTEIVYADKRNLARQRGAGRLDREYMEVTAVRAPEFDRYAPTGPTQRELFEEFGWWFECGTCAGMASRDGGARFLEREPVCAVCVERAAVATQENQDGA